MELRMQPYLNQNRILPSPTYSTFCEVFDQRTRMEHIPHVQITLVLPKGQNHTQKFIRTFSLENYTNLCKSDNTALLLTQVGCNFAALIAFENGYLKYNTCFIEHLAWNCVTFGNLSMDFRNFDQKFDVTDFCVQGTNGCVHRSQLKGQERFSVDCLQTMLTNAFLSVIR